jgi:hypothetical protein
VLLLIKVPALAAEYQSIAAPEVALVADTRTMPVPHLEPPVVTGVAGSPFIVAVQVARTAETQPLAVLLDST